VAKRTTNLASTNKTQVRAFQFPLPPTMGEQSRIVATMKASKGMLAGLSAKITVLDQLKMSLMDALLSGHVRVNKIIEAISL
jgi:hypothetical protein